MTTTPENQPLRRLIELSDLSRQRYLAKGGDPGLSVGSHNNNDCLTEEEKQEFSHLVKQLAPPEKIAAYLQEKGSWRDRIKTLK